MNKRITELESKIRSLENRLTIFTVIVTILSVFCGSVAFLYYKKTQRLGAFLNNVALFEDGMLNKNVSIDKSKGLDPIKVQSNNVTSRPQEQIEIEYESDFAEPVKPIEHIDFDVEHKLFSYAETSAADRLYQRAEYDRAIMVYQKTLIKPTTRDVVIAHSIFYQALSFQRLGDNDTAKVIYKKLIRKIPRSDYAVQAKMILEKL